LRTFIGMGSARRQLRYRYRDAPWMALLERGATRGFATGNRQGPSRGWMGCWLSLVFASRVRRAGKKSPLWCATVERWRGRRPSSRLHALRRPPPAIRKDAHGRSFPSDVMVGTGTPLATPFSRRGTLSKSDDWRGWLAQRLGPAVPRTDAQQDGQTFFYSRLAPLRWMTKRFEPAEKQSNTVQDNHGIGERKIRRIWRDGPTHIEVTFHTETAGGGTSQHGTRVCGR